MRDCIIGFVVVLCWILVNWGFEMGKKLIVWIFFVFFLVGEWVVVGR